jgi:hypothetical protein
LGNLVPVDVQQRDWDSTWPAGIDLLKEKPWVLRTGNEKDFVRPSKAFFEARNQVKARTPQKKRNNKNDKQLPFVTSQHEIEYRKEDYSVCRSCRGDFMGKEGDCPVCRLGLRTKSMEPGTEFSSVFPISQTNEKDQTPH